MPQKYNPDPQTGIPKVEYTKLNLARCECGARLLMFGCTNPSCYNFYKNNLQEESDD